MKFKHALGIAVLTLGFGVNGLYAQDGGTSAQAKALLEKAVTAVKADKAAALAKFIKKDGGFIDRDLYVFCFNMSDGKFTAHVDPKLMGVDIRTMNNPGHPYGKQLYDSAKEGTFSTVSYNFPKPGTTTPVSKHTFITKVADQGCGVGYYK